MSVAQCHSSFLIEVLFMQYLRRIIRGGAVCAVCLILMLGLFCLGYGIPESIPLPQQLDTRHALDKISCDMTLSDIQRIVSDSGFCEVISNSEGGLDTPWEYGDELVWTRTGHHLTFWHDCFLVSFFGTMWTHQYGFWFDESGRLQGIFLRTSSRYPDGQPLPWKWIPRFKEVR